MKWKGKNALLALVGVGLILLAVGYYAQDLGYSGGFIDLKKFFEKEEQIPELAVDSFRALVSDDASINFELKLLNWENHTIENVSLYYAVNPVDPQNANYTEVVMSGSNGTYTYTLQASFNDAIYYYALVTYDENKTLRVPSQDYNSLLVQDTVAPTISNLSLSYNATSNITEITVTLSDNDGIREAILYYAISNTSFSSANLTVENITWSNVTITSGSAQITVTPGNYLAFYITAEDFSNNLAREPISGYYELYLNETITWTPGAGS